MPSKRPAAPPRPGYSALTTAVVTLELAIVDAKQRAESAQPGDDHFAQRERHLREVEQWLEFIRMGGTP